jgi:hypothetical protein
MGQRDSAAGSGLITGLTFSGREKGPIAHSGKRTTCAAAMEPTAVTYAVAIAPERRDISFIVSYKKLTSISHYAISTSHCHLAVATSASPASHES